MAIKFRYNNTPYTLLHLGSRITTPSLCYRQNGTTYYAPLLTSRSQTIGSYVYDASYPTVCCRYNNTTYYAAKSRSSNYNIPAGTYSPADFENMIKQYISNNGSRIVANSFTVKVNNQSVSVDAGNIIYYKVESSSPRGYARYVSFYRQHEIELEACDSTHGFSMYKSYVTYIKTGSGFSFVNTFKTYANYPITVTTGIDFK